MKAGADFEQARDPAAQNRTPSGRLGDPAQDFQQRDLPAPLRPMMPSTSPRLTSKAHIPQGPEFLDLVALHDLPAAKKVDRLARKVASLARDDVAQRRVPFALGGLMSDQIALREILGDDDDVGHGLDEQRRSDQIGKALFHLPELADAQPQEKAGDTEAEPEAGQIELAFTAEQAPAKSVDDADHRIEGISKTPLLRNDAGAEADRRHIEAELHDERNDVAKIAILDVERRDPHADTEAGHERDGREHRQQQNLPARHELVPDHQRHEDREADEKIDEGDHHRRDRHDQPREIHLADQIGIADEAVRGIGQCGGKEAPGQHAGKHHQRIGRRAVRRQLGQLAENDGEHHHGQERPDERPGSPDHRLLVAHGDVAPGQDLKKLAVLPQVAPIVALSAAGFDYGFLYRNLNSKQCLLLQLIVNVRNIAAALNYSSASTHKLSFELICGEQGLLYYQDKR